MTYRRFSIPLVICVLISLFISTQTLGGDKAVAIGSYYLSLGVCCLSIVSISVMVAFGVKGVFRHSTPNDSSTDKSSVKNKTDIRNDNESNGLQG